MGLRRIAAASGLAAGLAMAGPASAVLPPYVYLDARASADVHLQVQVSRVHKVTRENAASRAGRSPSGADR
jgi:hypothetical protein